MAVNKKNLIDKVASETNENKKVVEEIFNSIFLHLGKTIKNEKKVIVPGFGVFKIVERKARTGINPRTKEKIEIAESVSVRFKPAKTFKEDLQ